MSTYISQKQHLTAGNEAVLDIRWPCTLYKSWFSEDAGLMALHLHKIGQNVVQNPIPYNFLVHIYCLFTYNQEIKLFMATIDKLQSSADNLHVTTEARSLGFETKSERGDNTLQFHVSHQTVEVLRKHCEVPLFLLSLAAQPHWNTPFLNS